MRRSIYDSYVSLLCQRHVKQSDHVFDCGCGSGDKTRILMDFSKHVIGGDLDKRVELKHAIDFRKIGVQKYGTEGEFDVVFSFDVIEHVEDDLGFLRELLYITKSGGTVIVGTPNRNRLSNKIISRIHGPISYPRNLGYDYASGGDIIHLREYTKADLLALASECLDTYSAECFSCFFGLYTPWGAVGLRGFDQRIFAKYAQHLFLVLKKR